MAGAMKQLMMTIELQYNHDLCMSVLSILERKSDLTKYEQFLKSEKVL